MSANSQFVQGRDAFLMRAHASFDSRLRNFFAKRGIARDEIPDLTQEVYVRLARLSDNTTVRSAQAFVFTTALNLIRDLIRRRATRGLEYDIGVVPDLPAEGVDPERAAECRQQLQAVWQVVTSLKPATRHVFVGHRIEGQSYAELALELGVSVSMIEKHMSSAIGALSPLR